MAKAGSGALGCGPSGPGKRGWFRRPRATWAHSGGRQPFELISIQQPGRGRPQAGHADKGLCLGSKEQGATLEGGGEVCMWV